MKSKINVYEIIEKHFSTLKSENEFIKRDKKIFFKYPIFIGLLMLLFINSPNEKLINIFTLSLSVFIGLFLNLLVLIISFAENKLKIKDSKNRTELLKQTFYNITYTIVVSLIGLGLLFIANISLFPKDWFINLSSLNNEYFCFPKIYANKIFELTFYFAFYIVFTHIIATLLMIIKRIYKLFNVEIENINSSEK